jgi:hypothetical protein
MKKNNCVYKTKKPIKRADGKKLPRDFCWLKDIVIKDNDESCEFCKSYELRGK